MSDATSTEHVTARVVALDALVRIEDGAYAHVVLPAMLAQTSLADRDRAFATDLVYGTVRSQRRLDDLLAHVVKRPLRRLDPPVRAALRLGAYQLLHDTPPHAAVASTVDAVGARSPRARGFVNANLRGLTRLPQPLPEPDRRRGRALVPRLVGRAARARARRRRRARAALVAMNEPAAVTLRPDPRQVTVDALADELRAAGAEVEPGRAGARRGRRARARRPRPSAPRCATDGRRPRTRAARPSSRALAPAPGERVADLAAAPGGKATAIAERVGREPAAVVAVDVDAGRVRMIDGARHRIGLPHLFPLVGDARGRRCADAAFDRVLLDAPCSGIGVLRRRPDARWRLEPEADRRARRAATRPARRRRAARAPGRRARVLGVHADHRGDARRRRVGRRAPPRASPPLPPPGAPWTPHGRGALLLPQAAGTDGMFVLVLRRSALSGRVHAR